MTDKWEPNLVTNGYRRWVAGGSNYEESALQRVHNVMTSDSLGRSDAEGRLRPSLLSDDCDRKQMLSFNAVPNLHEDLHGWMVAGTFGHYRWQLAGLSEGFLTAIEVPIDPGWYLHGSADGVCSDGLLFELKTTNMWTFKRIFESGVIKPEHAMQVEGYLLQGEWPAARVVYEDRNTLDTLEYIYESDPVVREPLVERLEMWTRHIIKETLPEPLMDCRHQTGDVFAGCPWRKTCLLQH